MVKRASCDASAMQFVLARVAIVADEVEVTAPRTSLLVPGTSSGAAGFRSQASTTKISLFKTSSWSAIVSCVYVLAALSSRPKETAIISEVFLNPIDQQLSPPAYQRARTYLPQSAAHLGGEAARSTPLDTHPCLTHPYV